MELDDRARAVLEQIANSAARQAVRDTLVTLGVDPANPITSQRDFAALAEMRGLLEDKEFQADLAHLRKWRQTVDGVQNKSMLAVVGVLVSGFVGLLVMGFQAWVGK